MIRIAQESDIAEMLAIYAPFVENTAVTFDMKVPTLVEFTKKIQTIQKEAPCLVYESNGEVLGYAYASAHRAKEAYKWTREMSVYIREDSKTKKYGTALYSSLIELLKCQNYRSVLAGITLPNIPSVNFHERFGFHPVGVYDNVGYKLGKSHRVGWWQLMLRDYQEPAKEIISLEQVLNTEEGQKALKKGESRILA
ncbi:MULTISPECIES: GNAT family N-acetyltransferase [unclassified Aureispira]|uniref:GNAT family N-acetyltransferase n=1 Tax=unclassified Aureispira TaxID=2649989 RepID=UPI000697D71C|nr:MULTISPECIES: GNAT family N-acetyltransferase [unclassified Aureispira]WMX14408.1 N-acetyltransferase family protein [Aureispira sp. CCB-E]